MLVQGTNHTASFQGSTHHDEGLGHLWTHTFVGVKGLDPPPGTTTHGQRPRLACRGSGEGGAPVRPCPDSQRKKEEWTSFAICRIEASKERKGSWRPPVALKDLIMWTVEVVEVRRCDGVGGDIVLV